MNLSARYARRRGTVKWAESRLQLHGPAATDRHHPGGSRETVSLDHAATYYRGFLSLELFNREYWKQSADENLATAMEKMRATVKRALA